MGVDTERCSLKTAVPQLLKISERGKKLSAFWRGEVSEGDQQSV